MPATQKLLEEVHLHGRADLPSPDDWLKQFATVPLLHQPGDGWLYHASYDVLGVLFHRVTGSLPAFLTERIYEPLGMTNTDFVSETFPSGVDGLQSTANDLLAFTRFLLSGDLLAERAVDTTTAPEREPARMFLDGQAGASAAAPTSQRSPRGTSRAATVGPAVPRQRPMSCPRSARSRSCSRAAPRPALPR